MNIIRYKPIFSVSAAYTLPGIGLSTEDIQVNAVTISENKMVDLKLKAQYKQNLATVFYEGIETPAIVPVTSVPVLEITAEEYFYFGIRLFEKERIKQLRFHSTPAKARETGFPVLYNAFVNAVGAAPTITIMEDIKVVLPVLTFVALAADTGISARFAALEIRNEKNALVKLDIPPVEINDKKMDGAAAVPEFAFSVDASSLEAGIYEFKVGNFKKNFFLANKIDLSEMVGLVRVLKNNFLDYKKILADKTFVQFNIQVPAA